METAFPYDVFLSHSAQDKAVVRPLAERLRQDGPPAKAEGRMEKAEILHSAFCILPFRRAFGSDWAQTGLTPSQLSTLNPQPTGAPRNQERRFIPLRLDDAPIKGSLAQFPGVNRIWVVIHCSQWN